MLPDKIIEPDTLQLADDRVRLSIRMPWYRALPLSCVADLSLTIDGRSVPRDSITWTVEGRTYRLDELAALHDQWWYVLDSVALEGTLPDPGDLAEHEVVVVLDLFIPYITTDFGVLRISETDRKRLDKVAAT